MPIVVGVKFNKSPKIYFFDPKEFTYEENCGVIVETARGVEYGKVVMLPTEVEESKIVSPLKPIMRMSTEKDIAQLDILEAKKPETMRITAEKIEKSKLDMKLVDVEYTFDGAKLIVYFTADGRVDFRDLVRELAGAFRVRIELRQIGARDECKMQGGLAPCGRACCCSDHLSEFAHVTIKMAKNQNLSLNPAKISGLCGRLMCCLSYENAHYVETNKRMPKVGSDVSIEGGIEGMCVGINQLKETVRVKVANKESFDYNDYPLAMVINKGKGSAMDDINKDEKLDDSLKSLID